MKTYLAIVTGKGINKTGYLRDRYPPRMAGGPW
jgi:hypothetical protein